MRLGPLEILGDGPDFLQIGAGAFNVIPRNESDRFENNDTVPELRLEYRFGAKFLAIGPLLGIGVNTDGGVLGYGGIYTDLQVGRVVVTPTFAVAGYGRNDSKDLGGPFQFNFGLEVGYRMQNGSRIGLRMTRTSNEGILNFNEGAESVMVVFTLPLP